MYRGYVCVSTHTLIVCFVHEERQGFVLNIIFMFTLICSHQDYGIIIIKIGSI